MRPATRALRPLVGAVLVMAVVVMGGLAALSAGVPSGPTAEMADMPGMTEMAGVAAGTNDVPPAGSVGEPIPVVGCDAMCGDLLHACLAVLTFLAASALALPGVRRMTRGAPLVGRPGPERRWVEEESPPWSVLSLSQLSVLRV